MELVLASVEPSRRADFESVLTRGSEDSAKCCCTAYHIADWDTPGRGPACRARLLDQGPSDGYLAYVDARAVGWCQAGPWSSFARLASKAAPLPDAWVISCMVVVPEARGRGVGHAFFAAVLGDLRRRGAPRVIAFAHRLGPTYASALPELPEAVCVKAGMRLLRDDPECPWYVGD